MSRRIALLAAFGCGGAPHANPPHPAEPAAPAAAEPAPAGGEPVLPRPGAATPGTIHCDNTSNAELSVDGLLDDWRDNQVVARAGGPGGAFALRCSWDGASFALALDVEDDRVVRVRGKGHEDRVDLAIAAKGGRAMTVSAMPGNAIARSKIAAPPRVSVADSLQPKGFSIELAVPASAIPELSQATPSLALHVVFHDADQAAGGADNDVVLDTVIELAERKDLLDDFLATVHLRREELVLDQLVDLDPDHRGKERLVAGGTVIGVLTDQFGYVSLPVVRASDVLKIELLPLGPRGSQVISAVVRQSGNGGSRDLLLLWTVWTGRLEPLAQIEVRKEAGSHVLASEWKVEKGKKGPELWVTPKPAVGWTAATWNEEPAQDADPILLPWDPKVGGTAYELTGKELTKRDLPKPKRRR